MSTEGTHAVLWRVIAASVPGTSHQKMGQPCQDAHYWSITPEGFPVAAVADGAGSASLGDVGAAIASRTAVEAICSQSAIPQLSGDDNSWQSLLNEALKIARIAVEAEASARNMEARDLATTLILLVATPELVTAAQVGDGAAVVGNNQGDIIALTKPQSGEYINETTFLISPAALDTAQVKVWRGAISHIAVISDGLQMLSLKMPDGKPHAPFFNPLFRFIAEAGDEAEAKEQLVAFLSSPRIAERTDDDLTLLLASLI